MLSEERKAESTTQKIIESDGPCFDVGKSRPANRTEAQNLITQQPKMGVEEQKEEREILESIYPEEITGKNNVDHIT